MKSLVLILLFAATVHADDTSRLRKAEEYLMLTQQDQRMKQMVDLMTQSLRTSMEKQPANAILSPEVVQLTRDFQNSVFKLLGEALSWDALRSEFIRLAADTFTEPELDDMVVFLKSPTGKAMIAKSEGLMTKGAAIGQRRAEAMQPALQRLSQEFNAKVQTLIRDSVPPRAAPKQ